MSVVITKEDLKAYTEVDYILKHMNEKYIKKLPENLIKFFDTIKDPDYEIYINPYKPLQEQGLSKYALEIIALLHVKYWCENPQRKEELLEKMKQNQERFEKKIQEQFNVDKFFDGKVAKTSSTATKEFIKTVYSQYVMKNPDIQDYTDVKDEEIREDLPQNIEEKVSFFGKIKKFIANIFKKNGQ